MKITKKVEIDVGTGTVSEISRALTDYRLPAHASAETVLRVFDASVDDLLDSSKIDTHKVIVFEWEDEE